MGILRPHSATMVADNDAPLIGERAQRAGASLAEIAMSTRV
jgi:hypothetical protein